MVFGSKNYVVRNNLHKIYTKTLPAEEEIQKIISNKMKKQNSKKKQKK